MTCNCDCNDQNAIILVRGNDTNFNDAQFLTIYLNTEILDLSTFKAVFKLGGITKNFDDISEGKIELNFTAQETSKLPSFCYGQLNLIDTSNRIATIESLIPFKVISVVDGNAIATQPYTLNFDVKQGGENILNVSVESAVTVTVGTTTTLPAGSNATVENVGTGNHLVLNFGIPKGFDGTGVISVNGKTGEVELDYSDVGALSADTTIGDLTTASQLDALNSGANSENIGQIAVNASNIASLADTVSDDYVDLNNKISSTNNRLSELSGTVTSNYNTLDAKIDDTKTAIDGDISDLSGSISDLSGTVESYNTATNGRIDILSQTVSANDTAINNKVDGINTTLTNSINSLSNTVTSNYNALDARITTNTGNIATNAGNITTINSKIPNQASSSNQLADKAFVNSSIATNTAYFIGTFNSVAELEAYSGTLTNNDYAFVATTDTAGNTLYDRYKYNANTQEWIFEYELNNSSFTAAQWASINSGIDSNGVAQITLNQSAIGTINTTLATFGNIVTHNVSEFATASQGSLANTALQPNDNISELYNNVGYITNAALAGYATQVWVTNQNYLTSSALSGYATEQWVLNQNYLTSSDLSGYATQTWVGQQGYLVASDLNGYATESFVTSQGYITASALPDTSLLSYYGTCATSASTQAKDVVCTGFTLKTGVSIRVKFTNAQSYNGQPTLNVNSTGAKNITLRGTTASMRYIWQAGEVIEFTYDGTNWIWDRGGVATTTYYGVTKLSSSLTSTSTALAATPSTINGAMQNIVTGYSVYSASETYAVGDRVRYSSYVWECTTAITEAEAWDETHWTTVDPIQTQIDDISTNVVRKTDIVSSVDSTSTNSQTVGAKLFYDTCGDIEALINAL